MVIMKKTLRPAGMLLEQLIQQAEKLPPARAGIVHPCDLPSLSGALAARDRGLITPTLIGPRNKILSTAQSANLSLADIEIVDAPHSHAAADEAVARVRQGELQTLMKGALHTDELMSAILQKGSGLQTERRMSHVFVIDAPSYHKLLLVTDAAININPNLLIKRDIVRNVIDLAHAIGIACPKIALLSAIETIEEKIPSTIQAAALCKMAERNQITGAILDGPLAFDNAISRDAATTKNIQSIVAGEADVLVAPDLEAGNILAKELVFLSGANTAGLVLGARAPIILTSRSDDIVSRVASSALAQLFIHRNRHLF